MSELDKEIAEMNLLGREKRIAAKEAEIKMQLENIEHTKSSMRDIYEDNTHLTDTRTISKMTDKFIDSLKEKGQHFCLHEQDWGKVVNSLANIEKKLDDKIKADEKLTDELIQGKNENAKKIAKLETTWKVSTGIIISVVVASWAIFVWSFEQLKELITLLVHK